MNSINIIYNERSKKKIQMKNEKKKKKKDDLSIHKY